MTVKDTSSLSAHAAEQLWDTYCDYYSSPWRHATRERSINVLLVWKNGRWRRRDHLRYFGWWLVTNGITQEMIVSDILSTPQQNPQTECTLPFLDLRGPGWAVTATWSSTNMWQRSAATWGAFKCSNPFPFQVTTVDGMFLSLLRGRMSSLCRSATLWSS